jgi:O-antigen/teichoic acid export membrane protein
MARVSTDLAANVASRAWTGILGFVFPPVYARLIGVEGYGLVGLFSTLTALFVVLDLGLSRTVVREVASLRATDDPQRVRDVVRTIEAFVWCVGAAFCVALYAAAPWVAEDWLGASSLSLDETIAGIRVMGLVCAVSWPVTLYGQVLLALRRQVATSVISAVAQTVRTAGAALVLWYGPRTVTAFFVWTLAVTIAWCAVVRHVVLGSAVGRAATPARVRPSTLTTQWRMSAAIWMSAAASVLISQLDRLIGSNVLSLREFGYYSLAVAAAAGVQYLSLPVWNAVFPRLCQVRSSREEEQRFFGLAVQIMAVLVVPAGLVLSLRSSAVLFAWTGRADVSANGAPVLAGLAIAATCNALAYIPLALLVARGKAVTPMRVYLVTLALAVPTVFAAGARWGGAGLAWSVALVAFGALVALALGSGLRESRTVLRHVAGVASASVTGLWLAGHALPTPTERTGTAMMVAVQAAVALAAGISMAPDVRHRTLSTVIRIPRSSVGKR